MTEIVYAEPTNAAFVAGTRRRIQGATFVQWGLTLIFTVLFAVPLYAQLRETWNEQAFRADGRLTTGRIIGLSSIRGTERHFVTYRYNVNGRIYEAHEEVTSTGYSNLRTGTDVRVLYVADSPDVARLAEIYRAPAVTTEKRWWAFGFGAIIFFLAVLWKEFQSYRYSRLGKLCSGELIAAEGRKVVRLGFVVTFRYKFQSPEGKTVSGGFEMRREDLRDAPLPAAGSPVQVLYIDDKQHRML
ncbi:MAG: DUF3592 domain-containing protein [Anaerolineae bacterium]|nr:DUF3592 domain-containing protein [Anaerolineae bacterium]